jgi:hypothetical protein
MAGSKKTEPIGWALAEIDRHVEELAARIEKGKVAPENRLKKAVDNAQKLKMTPRRRLAWAVILGMAIERARTRTRGKPGRPPRRGEDAELAAVFDHLRYGKARNLAHACRLATSSPARADTLRRRATQMYGSVAKMKKIAIAASGFVPIHI